MLIIHCLKNDYWLHTFTLQLPNMSDVNLNVVHNVNSVCNAVVMRDASSPMHITCTKMQLLLHTLQYLSDKSQGHLLRILNHITDLMPSWAWHGHRHAKRGFGSWLG